MWPFRGPPFSVQDVAKGWVRGLRRAGHQVAEFNLDDRLRFFNACEVVKDDGSRVKPFDDMQAVELAIDGLFGELYKGAPDLLFVVSGFYFPQQCIPLIQARGTKVVLLFTESPYEDDHQIVRSEHADLVLVNDPTNLDQFLNVNPNSHYQWHCYDDEVHKPGPPVPEWESDFCFIGTGYRSRRDFFEAVNWDGIKASIGGHWPDRNTTIPLHFFAHDTGLCCDNTETVDRYRSTKVSANLYRTEANRPDLSAGWSAGPREIELAATRTFFLRDPRGESDILFPNLPTFAGPEEFGDLIRTWLARPKVRAELAAEAFDAIRERTFVNAALRLDELLTQPEQRSPSGTH